MKRFEQLADELAAAIAAGVYAPGDRLPSVRQTRVARQVSASTVFKAYYLLEARGLVQARSQSGYYVSETRASRPSPAPARSPEVEASSRPPDRAEPVDVSALVFEVLTASVQRDVVPFGSAFPSPLLFPLPRLARSMAASVKALDPRRTLDDLTPGNADLRRQIAQRYRADGLDVDPAELVITNGALEALNLALLTVARPGDAVVIESPCFYAALQSIERNGMRAIEVATHPREGIELDALERALERHRPKACWLMTSFQNPLGSLMPNDKKRALVELLARYQVPLIEDDVYAELFFGKERPLPAKAFDRDGGVLHCASFSKCLAPGYRVGWIAAGRFTAALVQHKLTTTLTTAAPTQAALADYLDHGGYDRHLRQLRRVLAEREAAFAQAVARHFPAGTRATRPSGGYFLWLELDPGVDTIALQAQALALGISVAPGPIFSASRGHRHCLRLNFGHPLDARAEAALATLGRLAGPHARIPA
jgi:DNA-binding transcriptional MocR family regulator